MSENDPREAILFKLNTIIFLPSNLDYSVLLFFIYQEILYASDDKYVFMCVQDEQVQKELAIKRLTSNAMFNLL